MKINEIEKLTGLSRANIRFYEKEGLLSPGGRKTAIVTMIRRTSAAAPRKRQRLWVLCS